MRLPSHLRGILLWFWKCDIAIHCIERHLSPKPIITIEEMAVDLLNNFSAENFIKNGSNGVSDFVIYGLNNKIFHSSRRTLDYST